MKPVLFSLAGFSVSSFGIFLSISIALALFFIWRIIRVYELDEEKVIDLFILSVLSGFIFSRLYFVMFHPNQFVDFTKIFLINRYPGLPFWGGLIGGIIALKLLSRRYKMNFWQVADFAVVGLFIAISITSLGCLLGACQYGLLSDSTWAVTQAGIIGKRFPIQIIESLIFLIGFLSLSANALRFHFFGQILAQGLFFMGITKFILEFFRGDKQIIYGPISLGYLFSLALLASGVYIFYKQGRRSITYDLRLFLGFFYNSQKRRYIISKLMKSWYNLRINLRIALKRGVKSFFAKLQIKSNPNKF